MCTQVCQGQREILSIASDRVFSLACSSLIRSHWLAIEPKDTPVPTSPPQGMQACATMFSVSCGCQDWTTGLLSSISPAPAWGFSEDLSSSGCWKSRRQERRTSLQGYRGRTGYSDISLNPQSNRYEYYTYGNRHPYPPHKHAMPHSWQAPS